MNQLLIKENFIQNPNYFSEKIIEETFNESYNQKSLLEDFKLEDEICSKLTKQIMLAENKDEIILQMIKGLCELNYNEIYDWNIGNILANTDTAILAKQFKEINNKFYLYDSAGLAWALGEHNHKNIEFIEFLHKVIQKTRNNEAWWQAAFSLEKITGEDAITLLKHSVKNENLKTLDTYLKELNNKKSLVGILLHSNSRTIREIVYPKTKKVLLETKNKKSLLNCIWLVGRLKIIDEEIYQKLTKILKQTNDYETIHYILFSMNENGLPKSIKCLKKHLHSGDAKIRKLCIKCIPHTEQNNALQVLEKMLINENDEKVLDEISKALYRLRNPYEKEKSILEKKCFENENGLIIDESDKWYCEPAIYDQFSEAEDPENICFDLIMKKIHEDKITLKNPVDLATGTGRMLKQILQKVNYEGTAYATDINQKMLDYLEKTLNRKKLYVKKVKLLKTSNDRIKLEARSTLVLSSFGFPSKITDPELCVNELREVCNLLDDKGVFVTLGWDETFNDELNEMWFKYLPDKIKASNFEEWRGKRASLITNPRNCGLTWLKKGLKVPLHFNSLTESALVIGNLFGRDAAKEVLKNKRTEWLMSIGITYNTKEELIEILREYDERNRGFSGVA